ncbi:hypothetical protein AB4Y43_17155 [Paraburkholderia sp. BR10872]|uniref:hypothetical protein n=1 Tax=Paraburkholderia sp. BR10872 TaxID=3236989 RepID=UPI0034D18858
MSKVDDFTRRVGHLRRLTQDDIEPAAPAAAAEIPTGAELANGGTRHPGRPRSVGQIAVFRSPYARDTFLVDVVEKDRYEQLRWVALPDSDPRYGEAIATATGQLPALDPDTPVEPTRSRPLRPQ